MTLGPSAKGGTDLSPAGFLAGEGLLGRSWRPAAPGLSSQGQAGARSPSPDLSSVWSVMLYLLCAQLWVERLGAGELSLGLTMEWLLLGWEHGGAGGG